MALVLGLRARLCELLEDRTSLGRSPTELATQICYYELPLCAMVSFAHYGDYVLYGVGERSRCAAEQLFRFETRVISIRLGAQWKYGRVGIYVTIAARVCYFCPRQCFFSDKFGSLTLTTASSSNCSRPPIQEGVAHTSKWFAGRPRRAWIRVWRRAQEKFRTLRS